MRQPPALAGTSRASASWKCGFLVAGAEVAVVRAPDGSEPVDYRHAIDLPRAAGESTVPLATNDFAGEWEIVVRDVATGVEGSASFRVDMAGA